GGGGGGGRGGGGGGGRGGGGGGGRAGGRSRRRRPARPRGWRRPPPRRRSSPAARTRALDESSVVSPPRSGTPVPSPPNVPGLRPVVGAAHCHLWSGQRRRRRQIGPRAPVVRAGAFGSGPPALRAHQHGVVEAGGGQLRL